MKVDDYENREDFILDAEDVVRELIRMRVLVVNGPITDLAGEVASVQSVGSGRETMLILTAANFRT